MFLGNKDIKIEIECVKIRESFFVKKNSKGNLYLLPGSISLATLEPEISLAHHLCTSENFPILNNLPGATRGLFIEASRKYNADIVIIDMGPSIGELNKNIFLNSDYFIIPTAADAYCKSTINTM